MVQARRAGDEARSTGAYPRAPGNPRTAQGDIQRLYHTERHHHARALQTRFP